MAGQEVDFGGGIVPADQMVEKEVVQNVGTNLVLGLLGDLPLGGGRQQLGRNRGGADILEDGRGLLAEFALGAPGDEIAHQGLRHAGVDPVHRHVIGVVGAPAESQFGQVAGAEHQPTDLIGHIHEDLGAFPRLGIFIGDIVQRLGVADVGEMTAHRAIDGNDPQLDAEEFGQAFGIPPGAGGGAETGQGQGDDPFAVEPETLEGLDRHQQRQGRIEAAGDAEDHPCHSGVAQAFGQSRGLQGEDLPAAGGAFGIVSGDKGGCVERAAGGAGRKLRQVKRDFPVAGAGRAHGETAGAGPFAAQAREIDIGQNQLRIETKTLGFRQQHPIFGDERMSGKDQIGTRLARPRRSIGVSGQAARRLTTHQITAVGFLAQGFRTGRRVEQHRRTLNRHGSARRVGDPQILAQLDTDQAFRAIDGAEKQISTKGDRLTVPVEMIATALPGRSEPALLVEFVAVGQMDFRDDAEDTPLAESDRAVVEAVILTDRRAHHQGQTAAPGIGRQYGEGAAGLFDEQGLEEEVAAAVTGEGQFRAEEQGTVGRLGLIDNPA